MVYELKTKINNADVKEFLNTIWDTQKRDDCFIILVMFTKLSWEAAKMWWKNIVWFWSYDYTYSSGHSGSSARISFSPRASYISLYIMPWYEFGNMPELMKKLWKFKAWKCCLNIKKLSDVDLGVLEKIIEAWLDDMNERYPE